MHCPRFKTYADWTPTLQRRELWVWWIQTLGVTKAKASTAACIFFTVYRVCNQKSSTRSRLLFMNGCLKSGTCFPLSPPPQTVRYSIHYEKKPKFRGFFVCILQCIKLYFCTQVSEKMNTPGKHFDIKLTQTTQNKRNHNIPRQSKVNREENHSSTHLSQDLVAEVTWHGKDLENKVSGCDTQKC